MSELQVEDWKLEAQAVVQLCRKKCDKSASLSVLSMKNVTANYVKVSLGHMKWQDFRNGTPPNLYILHAKLFYILLRMLF